MVKWSQVLKMRSGRDSRIALTGTAPASGDFYDTFDEYVPRPDAEKKIAEVEAKLKGERAPITATLKATVQKAVGTLEKPAQVVWLSTALFGETCGRCNHRAERKVCNECKCARSNWEPE